MKHPTDEQWMELLYEELPPEQKAEIETHLKGCADCAQKRAMYIQTRKRLDAWNVAIPQKPRLEPQWPLAAKWAAAAALLVTTAFATGRFSKAYLDSETIQSQISRPLEEKLSREWDVKVRQQARLTAENVVESVRAKMLADVAARLEQISDKAGAEMAASKEQAALVLAALRERDQTLYAALQEIESKRQTEYRSFREDLEKLALFTEHSVRSTQEQLVQLASLNETPEK